MLYYSFCFQKIIRTLIYLFSSIILLNLISCGSSSDSSEESQTSTLIASAGADQSALEGVTITLDGSASSDSEGTITVYSWTQTGGPSVTINNADSAISSFTTPMVSGATDLTFLLSITNDASLTDDDTITITVNTAASASQKRISVMHYDFDNNGTAEGIAELSYDTAGRIIHIDYTYTDDGTLDADFRGIFILDFSTSDEVNEFSYDANGRMISMTETTATDRFVSTFTWNTDDLITDVVYQFFDPSGALLNTVRFDLDYLLLQLMSWDEEFEVTGSPATSLATGTLTYDINTGLLSNISRTVLIGTPTTESSAYSFNSLGLISEIITTLSDDPTYESQVGFSYATLTHPFVISGRNREGDLFNRSTAPNDPADTYNWGFSYTDSLLDTQIIDMDSDVIQDAIITFEWEDGICQPSMIWAPRAEPNFIADGNEPYSPGSGYVYIDYCDTRGSKL